MHTHSSFFNDRILSFSLWNTKPCIPPTRRKRCLFRIPFFTGKSTKIRGFDSFYGFYGAREGYFNHSAETKDPKTKKIISGLDLFNEVGGVSSPDFSKYGIYSTTLFANESMQVLKRHPKENPFFMYLAFQSVHVPLEVPFYYETFCEKLKNNRKRYVYC
uniref:Sulfatase N-terminal domain-containing protein n=1 Tax=Acrobeloides nanus TaxID=290746 RepID=A0A914C693_9BILA